MKATECESRYFWKSVRAMREADRAGNTDRAAEYREAVEIVSNTTTSSMLRRRCAEALAEHDEFVERARG